MPYSLTSAENHAASVPADHVRPLTLDEELRGFLAYFQRTFSDDETRHAALHDELQTSPVHYQHPLARPQQNRHLDSAV